MDEIIARFALQVLLTLVGIIATGFYFIMRWFNRRHERTVDRIDAVQKEAAERAKDVERTATKKIGVVAEELQRHERGCGDRYESMGREIERNAATTNGRLDNLAEGQTRIEQAVTELTKVQVRQHDAMIEIVNAQHTRLSILERKGRGGRS